MPVPRSNGKTKKKTTIKKEEQTDLMKTLTFPRSLLFKTTIQPTVHYTRKKLVPVAREVYHVIRNGHCPQKKIIRKELRSMLFKLRYNFISCCDLYSSLEYLKYDFQSSCTSSY